MCHSSEGTSAPFAIDTRGIRVNTASGTSAAFSLDTRGIHDVTGLVRVTIEPQGARDAGAQWRVDGGAWRNSREFQIGLSLTFHTVEFRNIPGWNRPGNRSVSIVADHTQELLAEYVPAQSLTAVLEGVVAEQNSQGGASGALLGATVEVTAGVTATTDDQGRFRLGNLTPGSYTVTASKAGYNAATRTIDLAAGDSRTEVFHLLRQNVGVPAAYDYYSEPGPYLIEGMPGDWSFETIVAWNGSPGKVRFLLAGTWYAALVHDIGGGLARAVVDVPAVASISSTSELMIEVTNGEAQKTRVKTGVFFHPVPDVLLDWYMVPIQWSLLGKHLHSSREASFTIWDFSIPSGVFSSEAGISYSQEIKYDPWAGVFTSSQGGSGQFGEELQLAGVENLGEGSLDFSGSLNCTFKGCETPNVTGELSLDLTGKAGVGAPVVQAVGAVFPAAVPVIQRLEAVAIVGDILKVARLRLFLIAGGGVVGTIGPESNCWLGANSYEVSVTLGAEAQALLAWDHAELGIYAAATGTPALQVCPELEFQGLTLRGAVGVFASAFGFECKEELGWEMVLGSPGKNLPVLFQPQGGNGRKGVVWVPIGSTMLEWGEANRAPTAKALPPAAPKSGDRVEETILENVTSLAAPSVQADSLGLLILFALHDPVKPWYAATDVGQMTCTPGGTWALARVTDDEQAEFSPALENAGTVTTSAAWERAVGDVSGAQGPDDVAPYIEIVAARLDRATGTWSTPKQLTNNAVVDRTPQPVAFSGQEGIVWIENEGAASFGNATYGDRLLYAPWTGSAWGAQQILWSGQKGILDLAFLADAGGEGHVVFAADEDGNTDTVTDRELYGISTVSGVWQAAVRLTTDDVEDAIPVLVAADGIVICVWKNGGILYYSPLAGWNPKEVYSESTNANLADTLEGITMPGGAAIAYTVQGENGIDIVAAFYDTALDRWSLPKQLTHDEHAESSLSLAYSAGELVIAYLKTQTVRSGVDVDIGGETYHIDNVPQPARTDLCVLKYSLTQDLAVQPDSIGLDPINPAPGSEAIVSVTIENRGELPIQGVDVVLYDGDPLDGGTVTATVPITEPPSGGATRAIVFNWTVPSDPNAHKLYVVADPALTLNDQDRANNITSTWTVLPDLVIDTCRSEPVSTSMVALTVGVANQGVIPSGAFDIVWRLNSAQGEEIGRTTVGGLEGGSGAIESMLLCDFSGHTSASGFLTLYVAIDPDNAVRERDKSNNNELQSVQVVFEIVAQCFYFDTFVQEGQLLALNREQFGIAGMPSNWAEWDIDGGGIPDMWELALLAHVLCDDTQALHSLVTTQWDENYAQLEADLNDPLKFAAYGEVLTGLIGLSTEMQATYKGLVLQLTGHYHIYGVAGKLADEPFAPEGDLDGDGLSNLDEYQLVVAVGGGVDLFCQVASDPSPFWPGNPPVPVSRTLALGLLITTVCALGVRAALRKRKRNCAHEGRK
jgi:hypothetical protein